MESEKTTALWFPFDHSRNRRSTRGSGQSNSFLLPQFNTYNRFLCSWSNTHTVSIRNVPNAGRNVTQRHSVLSRPYHLRFFLCSVIPDGFVPQGGRKPLLCPFSFCDMRAGDNKRIEIILAEGNGADKADKVDFWKEGRRNLEMRTVFWPGIRICIQRRWKKGTPYKASFLS